MERTHVLIARVRRAGMPCPDKIPWSAVHQWPDPDRIDRVLEKVKQFSSITIQQLPSITNLRPEKKIAWWITFIILPCIRISANFIQMGSRKVLLGHFLHVPKY